MQRSRQIGGDDIFETCYFCCAAVLNPPCKWLNQVKLPSFNVSRIYVMRSSIQVCARMSERYDSAYDDDDDDDN
jgi:hypothetical protein